MNFLTKFSLKNPAAIFILIVLIVFGGTISAIGLKKETMPDISIPIVAVVTPYPGASPSDILNDVTKPMEDAIQNVSGVKNVSSTSADNVSAVIAEFEFSADMEEAKREIEEVTKKVTLPENALDPQITRISFGSFPIVSVSIANEKISTEELEKQVRDKVVSRLSGVEGVGQVNLGSESSQAVFVRLLPDKLKEHNLTTQQVTQQLQANNVSFPTGAATIDNMEKPIRVAGNFHSLEDIQNLKIPVFPNQNDAMKEVFEQIGDGMGQLGNAVGEMGKAMGQMGQGMQAGMAGMTQGFNGQIQLLNAIQQTQSQLLAGQIALSDAKNVLSNPNASAQEIAIAQATIQKLTPQLQTGQVAVQTMQAKLKEIQSAMSKGVSTPAKSTSTKSKPVKAKEVETKEAAITLVSLKDIAEVKIDNDDASAYSRTNGKPSVIVEIVKTQDSNTVDVAEAVKAELDVLKKSLPEGTDISISFDQSEAVKDSVYSMVKEGLLGALFACVVILLFLRSFRSTIISIVSIPLSILIAMVFLKQAGITLNIMTLGGLAVAVGRVVDDSIVVVENIYRHLQNSQERSESVIKLATKEVASAITSSTLTTVAVFLPLAFVGGIIGNVFKPFAYTVSLSLLASLLVAVTVVPLLAKFTLLKTKVKNHEEKIGRMGRGYQSILNWSLNHKFIVLFTSFVLLVGSFALVPYIGTSFMPSEEEKYMNIDVTYPAGTSIDVVNKKAVDIEKILGDDKDVITYQTTVGTPKGSLNMQGNVEGSNVSHLFVQLQNEADVNAVVKRYIDATDKIKDKATITVAESSAGSAGMSNTLDVIVTGTTLEDIEKATQTITKELSAYPGLEHVKSNLSESKPEIDIQVVQELAADKGLSAAQVGSSVRELLNESKVAELTVDKQKLEVRVGLKSEALTKIEDIRDIELTTALGKKIKLAEIAFVKEVAGPTTLYTQNGEQYAKVTADIADKDTGKVALEVTNKVNAMKLPNGVKTTVGGSIEQMNESFKQLGIAIVVAIFAVYFVMVVAFGEATAPFAILFSLPLAIIGGLVALFVTGQQLNMPAMIGALMLVGIVVTNAIVLLDRVQHNRANGMSMREALLEAGAIRMRPIFMTAIATICALMPMAMGASEGALMSQSLAIVVIGGLITSTVLTLLVVPVAYEMLERMKKKNRNQ